MSERRWIGRNSDYPGYHEQRLCKPLLRPLYESLKSEVMKAAYVQADETTTPVINKETHKAAKEYLFCGNHEAAENMAVVCSLLATCRNHDVNPRDYLNDVIGQMPYHAKASHEELIGLLPHKWKLTHPEALMTKTT